MLMSKVPETPPNIAKYFHFFIVENMQFLSHRTLRNEASTKCKVYALWLAFIVMEYSMHIT